MSDQKDILEPAADLPVMHGIVMTVEGPIPNRDIGITLMSETIIGNGLQGEDLPSPLYPELWDKPVTLDLLGKLRRDIWSNHDNWNLNDTRLTIDELQHFQKVGGTTVVNAPYGGKANPKALLEISAKTGVNIVANLAPSPIHLHSSNLKSLREYLIKESRNGISGSLVRPGLLGPFRINNPNHPTQQGILQEILQAQKEIGVPILIRPDMGKLNILVELLQRLYVEPNRIILDVDVVPDPSSIVFSSAEGGAYGAIVYSRVLPDGLLRAAEYGYYLAFASFGFEVYHDRDWTMSARDPQRIKGIAQLIEHGHLHQIMLSQGIRLKTQLREYGGWGYAHIMDNIIPMMQREGFAPKQITTMLIWNPARALACE